MSIVCRKANLMALDNSASPSSRILIGQCKRKPPESCQKVVTKLSKVVGWLQLDAIDCNKWMGFKNIIKRISFRFFFTISRPDGGQARFNSCYLFDDIGWRSR